MSIVSVTGYTSAMTVLRITGLSLRSVVLRITGPTAAEGVLVRTIGSVCRAMDTITIGLAVGAVAVDARISAGRDRARDTI